MVRLKIKTFTHHLKSLNERCLNEKNDYGLSEERIAEYRKFLHENWTDWSKLKKWLLESTPVKK
jgi:hypothetical protein